MSKLLWPLWFLVIVVVAIYSYGFLDFNLTLSSHPLFLQALSPLQHLVYFERFNSAQLYVVLFALLFVIYLRILSVYRQSRLTAFPWHVTIGTVIVLTLAYPMLSYDLFNYMFHGKILWLYHQNPHVHAPLEYSNDLWLRFMRWVHTPSAYGPVFTVIESPAYLLGLGKFVPVLYLMKVTMSGFFLWCIYLIGRIGAQLKLRQEKIVQAQLLLALNPFLLFELIINGHNDAVMMAFFLLALSYSLSQEKVRGWISLALSAGVKYVTVAAIPAWFIKNPQRKIIVATSLLLLPILLAPGRFQPWYLVWPLVPAVLIDRAWARTWVLLASLAGLSYYVQYIATGFWSESDIPALITLYLPVIITLAYERISRKNYRLVK